MQEKFDFFIGITKYKDVMNVELCLSDVVLLLIVFGLIKFTIVCTQYTTEVMIQFWIIFNSIGVKGLKILWEVKILQVLFLFI